jgi:tRNA pseudouridine55 synthase
MDWCGMVAVDKPAGFTSREIVDKIAKIVRPAKAGHAGTLDPLATGVLVIAVGSATRLISYVQQGRKKYVGQFRLGQRSDTDDISGQVTTGGDWTGITEPMLTEAIRPFVGTILQVPPQYSAVHVDGRRAYALARRGQAVELPARPVEVHSLRVTRFQPPDFELEIDCGSGTYVRSIGRDLGESLGCGAVMTSLRRLAVGSFTVENAIPFDSLDASRLEHAIQPPLNAIADLPRRVVDGDEIRALRQGRTIEIGSLPPVDSGTEVALIDINQSLIGVARVGAGDRRLQPHIIFPT